MDTFVDTGDAVFKVDESGQLVETVLLGFGQVADLDEADVVDVAVVVDVLQFLEDDQVLLIALVVCKSELN